MVSDGRARQLSLVGLLDAALADLVAGLVGRAERLGLSLGGGHHGAGEQRDGTRLGDHRGRAQLGAVGGQHRGPGWPDGAQHEPLAGPQPGVDGGRAPVHPPLPVPGDQLKLSRIGPHVPAGQVGGGREAGPGRSAVLADLAEPEVNAAQAEFCRGLPQRAGQAGGRHVDADLAHRGVAALLPVTQVAGRGLLGAALGPGQQHVAPGRAGHHHDDRDHGHHDDEGPPLRPAHAAVAHGPAFPAGLPRTAGPRTGAQR